MQSNSSIEPPDLAVPGVIPGLVCVHDDGVAAYDGLAAEPTPSETSDHADPRGKSKRARVRLPGC